MGRPGLHLHARHRDPVTQKGSRGIRLCCPSAPISNEAAIHRLLHFLFRTNLKREPTSPRWTANLRAERDLLRQLVPANETNPPNVLDRTPAQLVTDAQNLEAYELLTAPENSTLPDDYSIEDANAGLFGESPSRSGHEAKLPI